MRMGLWNGARGYGAPHTPLQAPRELEARFSASLDPQVRTYAAMVLAMDRAFERTVGALRQV